jgi:hypothetical protein
MDTPVDAAILHDAGLFKCRGSAIYPHHQHSSMPALKILCTRKTGSPEIHLAISHVGGVNTSKLPWTLSVEDAIRTLELKQYAFYVMLETRRTDVFVAQTKSGHKYLKCTADIIEGDTLSGLADCP